MAAGRRKVDQRRRSTAVCSHGRSPRRAAPMRAMSPRCFSVMPMSSRPSSRRVRSAAQCRTGYRPGLAADGCYGKSAVNDIAPFAATTRCTNPSIRSAASSIVSMPFCKQLPAKVSAKLSATTQRMPLAISAHCAVSRADPQPKLLPATRIDGLRNCGWCRMKSGFSPPSAPAALTQEQHHAVIRIEAPHHLLRRDLVGGDVVADVGHRDAGELVNGCMSRAPRREGAHVGDAARDG